MNIGIFSDVHSNLEALRRVRDAYAELEVFIDSYVCLGDVVGYGADPNACCEIVRDMVETTVLGNHDAAVSGRMNYSFYYDAARDALDWHAAQLQQEHHAWLSQLGYFSRWEDVEFCHGSPVNREEFEYVFTEQQADQLLDHWEQLQHVTFIGHSHLTKSFELDREAGSRELAGPQLHFAPDKKYIVTVGSVGQPRDNDNRACFGVYRHEEKSFRYHRVDYDVRSAARKIFATDLSSDFAKRLFFGI